MMPLRSRYHKRYLLAVILGATLLLVINTQLQVSTFQSRYTIEISRSITPYTGNKAENSTQTFGYKEVPVDDEGLINFIKGFIEYGNTVGTGYNLSDDRLGDRSRGQALQMDVYLKYKVKGYFVEIGAGDGESGSVTLMLERERQWNGLLIEPDPTRYRKLVEKRRQALLLNACVKTNMTEDWIVYITGSNTQRVPCFWLESILRANAISTIDVLTIDVNGKEETILKSFPFDKFRVTIVTVELNGKFAISDSLSSLMKERGFRTVKVMSNHVLDKTDIMFAKI